MRLISTLILLGLTACGPDTDQDGLTDAEEMRLGTDPSSADSDLDAEDGEEVEAGTNPLYIHSHPYEAGYRVGYCAEPPDPTEAVPTGAASLTVGSEVAQWAHYQEGDLVENITFRNALGEDVDLYSFCGLTVYMTVSATWCAPCRELAVHLGELHETFADAPFTSFELLYQNHDGNLPSSSDLQAWTELFDLHNIPVTAPPVADAPWLLELEGDGFIPTVIVIGPDMRIRSMDEGVTDPSAFIDY